MSSLWQYTFEATKFFQSGIYVVVQFYPWFKFSFLLFLGMVMYDNNMIMSLKQKKRKFEPRIKLNHNIYTVYQNWVLLSKFLVKVHCTYLISWKLTLKFLEFLLVLLTCSYCSRTGMLPKKNVKCIHIMFLWSSAFPPSSYISRHLTTGHSSIPVNKDINSKVLGDKTQLWLVRNCP